MPQTTLRPADIAVALQLCLSPDLRYAVLAHRVHLSVGEVHNAVKRLEKAGLVRPGTRAISKQKLLEFALHGVPYAFPPERGPDIRGVPTAHSSDLLAAEFASDHTVVWPFVDGTARGQSLEPLYPGAPKLVQSNPDLYRALALIDSLRIGQARERKRATQLLEQMLA